jgi:hypothetical protein
LRSSRIFCGLSVFAAFALLAAAFGEEDDLDDFQEGLDFKKERHEGNIIMKG